jgi:hypothetical protein
MIQFLSKDKQPFPFTNDYKVIFCMQYTTSTISLKGERRMFIISHMYNDHID